MRYQIAFVTGVTLCVFLPDLPGWEGWVIPIVLLYIFLPISNPWRTLILWVSVALVGLGYAAWRAKCRLADDLSPSLEAKEVTVVAVVRDLSPSTEQRMAFLMEVEQILYSEEHVPHRIRVVDRMKRAWPTGSRWKLKVRLMARWGTANPYGYDAEQWMWASGVLANGKIARERQRLDDASDFPAWLDRLRDRMVLRAREVVGASREGAMVLALSVGAHQDISAHDWQLFSQTGLNHLVAISGLHIGMVAGMAAWLTRQSLRRWPVQRVVPQVIVALVMVLVATSYALLAGFSVPTRRALFMIASAALMLIGRRVLSPFQIAWTSLALVLLWDPFAVLTPGLWLSFGLVGALLVGSVGRRVSPQGWRAMATAQLTAPVMSIVPLALFFGTIPLMAPLANALAIPYISFVVTPLSLLGVLLPIDGVLRLAAGSARWFLTGLDLFHGAPVLTVAHAPWVVSALALFGSLWLIMPKGFPGRSQGVLLLAPLLLYRPPTLPVGGFRMTVLDVGQGLAVLIQTSHRALLYDTGALAANAVVLPQLNGMGIHRLDRLVLSHHDIDHDGAAPAIVNAIPVTSVLAGQAETWSDHQPVVADQCLPGMEWLWDGVRFEVLSQWPPDKDASKNARSCVVRVVGRYHSLLLTGDIPAIVERRLVNEVGPGLKSDIMTSPHHGGKTSSTKPFLAQVAPSWVIISVGYRNRYGHPHNEILQRYQNVGIRILRTDLDGAITVESASSLTITRFRHAAARYWRPRYSGHD